MDKEFGQFQKTIDTIKSDLEQEKQDRVQEVNLTRRAKTTYLTYKDR
jgi:hypothetical protein